MKYNLLGNESMPLYHLLIPYFNILWRLLLSMGLLGLALFISG